MSGFRLGDLLEGSVATYHLCGPDTRVRELRVHTAEASPDEALFIFPRLAWGGSVQDARASKAGVWITHGGWALPEGQAAVRVEDPEHAYGQIAARRYGEPARSLRLAGVTGTNGKTTTTWLVSSMLRAAGRPHARLGTLGHLIVDAPEPTRFTSPLPLELQRLLALTLQRGGQDVVMEVSSHALHQLRTWPARFDVVGMSNLTWDHLDYHGDMEHYRAAKRSLAEQHLSPSGVAVAFVDEQPACREFLEAAQRRGARAWRASRRPGEDAELQAMQVEALPGAAGYRVALRTPVGEGALHVPLCGLFNVENALLAVGMGLGLGLELGSVLQGVAEAGPPPGRLSWVSEPGPERVGVVVDYAHTPDALTRVMGATRPRTTGRLWVVFGCGGDRDAGKRPEAGRVVSEAADLFVATMDNPRGEDPEAIIQDMLSGVPSGARAERRVLVSRREAIHAAVLGAAPGDVVLIAGKGAERSIRVGDTELPHVDADVAAEALRAR